MRFGLRAADDPRIVNTVKVIDASAEIGNGDRPVWHRYNDDGYGEHDDGSPFDGTGIGRGWPLLAGERAHYELANGNADEAERLLKIMAAQTSPGGFLPEQVWDADDIPSGSCSTATVRLGHAARVGARRIHQAAALAARRARLRHAAAARRALPEKRHAVAVCIWRFNHKVRHIQAGETLRLEAQAPGTVHWSSDGWQTTHDLPLNDTSLGVYVADLPSGKLAADTVIDFTFLWDDQQGWQGENFQVTVQDQD